MIQRWVIKFLEYPYGFDSMIDAHGNEIIRNYQYKYQAEKEIKHNWKVQGIKVKTVSVILIENKFRYKYK